MSKVALLGPKSNEDVWNIPISVYNHLKKLNHEVIFYNTLVDDKFNDSNLKILIEDNKSGKFVPDVVLHLDFGFFNSGLLKKEYIPNAKWVVESGDDPQNFVLNFSKIKKGNFDLVLSPDIRAVKEYSKHNIKAAWFPHFADPDQYNFEQETVWVSGTTRSIEESFFAELKQKLGDQFMPRTEKFLQGLEHSSHLKKCSIVVQNSKYKEITRRLFEGMMANRLVITDRPDPNTRIDLIFKENEHVVYFDDIQDCVEKIKYFSLNSEERIRIAKNGFDLVSSKHTTACRLKQIFKHL